MTRLNQTSGRVLSRAQTVVAVVLIWTVMGIVFGVSDVLSGGKWPNFVGKMVEALTWAPLTPAIVLVDRWLSRKLLKIHWRVAVLLLLSVPFSFAHVYATAAVLLPIHSVFWDPLRDPSYTVHFFIGGMGTYSAIIATLMALQYYKRFLTSQLELERVQRRLLQSHLNMLRLQLEPHFLFNALNAISSEVVCNPELARDMIEDLGTLLRLSLDYKDRAEISLVQEIGILDHYLALQKIRYGSRLAVDVCIDPEVASTLVPCMLLQPLVENAIRHGISSRLSGGTVKVTASRVNGHVELRVEDDGIGLPPGWQLETAKGLGITVTRERLEALYPDAARHFDIRRRDGGGTEVVMRVPLHQARENANEPALE